MTTELRLCVGIENGKSTITDRYFTSPLKLGMPVSRGDRLQIILMMASAGILKGDEFVYEICCEEGTKTRLTEQSYTKIFDTGEGGAKRTQIPSCACVTPRRIPDSIRSICSIAVSRHANIFS